MSRASHSFMDAVWSGSGDLALREPPAELCILSKPVWDLRGWKSCLSCLRAWSFLLRTRNNTCLVQIYRNIITWPGLDLGKGSTTPRSLDTSSCPFLPFPRKGLCWELLGSLGFESWATCLLGGPTLNLTLHQKQTFRYLLAPVGRGAQRLVFQ